MTSNLKNSIILIGMPGSGKSTVGKVLADYLDLKFIDTDVILELKRGTTLQSIIDTHGYERFRQVEEIELVMEKFNNNVVATGGSVVYSQPLMQSFKNQGIVIHLDIPLEDMEKRIANDNPNRGIASPAHQSLRDIYNERTGLYKHYADLTVSNHARTPAETATLIAQKLNTWKFC
ncbi:MAG: shikimate kinase [Bdellovibrionales bacterium]